MELVENLKKYRMFRQITQQQLANILGKSKSVISNWERGENFPNPHECEQICRVLDITPNQLFGWEENKDFKKFMKQMEQIQKMMEEGEKA